MRSGNLSLHIHAQFAKEILKIRIDMNDKYDILDVIAVIEISAATYLFLKFMGV